MDTEKQTIIKKLVDDMGTEDLVVVIGAVDHGGDRHHRRPQFRRSTGRSLVETPRIPYP